MGFLYWPEACGKSAPKHGVDCAAMVKPLREVADAKCKAGNYNGAADDLRNVLGMMDRLGFTDEELVETYMALIRIYHLQGRCDLAITMLQELVQRVAGKYIKRDSSFQRLYFKPI
jgi:hypothetical protein